MIFVVKMKLKKREEGETLRALGMIKLNPNF
jgi:hypothetical protein